MHDAQQIKSRSITGVISYAFRSFFLQAIALLASLLLAYYLSPEEFGIFFIVSSVIGLFTFLSDVGLAATLVQKKEEPTIQELRTTFTVQQFLAFFIAITIVALTPFWQLRYDLSQEGLYLLYALAGSFILASLKTIPSILLERDLEFNKLVVPQIAEHLVFYGVTVWLASQDYGLMSYTYAVWFRGIVGVVLIYLIKPWSIGIMFSLKAFKGLVRYGAKFQLNDLLARIKDDLLIVVMGWFIPAAQMGYISWAKRWSVFPFQLTVQSVMSITFPAFSRLQGYKELLQRAIEKSLFFVSFIIFPMLAGMMVAVTPLLSLVPRYDKWTPAILPLMFFCLNIAWASISTPLISALNAIGKIDQTMKLMLFWTGLTWILTPFFVVMYGYVGIAIASFAVSCTSFLTIILVKKHVQLNVMDQIWRQGLASVVMAVAVHLLYTNLTYSWKNFLLGLVVGVASYSTVMLLIGYQKIKVEVMSIIRRRHVSV